MSSSSAAGDLLPARFEPLKYTRLVLREFTPVSLVVRTFAKSEKDVVRVLPLPFNAAVDQGPLLPRRFFLQLLPRRQELFALFLVEVVFHDVRELPYGLERLADLLDARLHCVDDGRVTLRRGERHRPRLRHSAQVLRRPDEDEEECQDERRGRQREER